MKHFKNDTASFYSTEPLIPYLTKFCSLAEKYPFIFKPERGINDKSQKIFGREGFDLISTVKRTTLLYSRDADSFFKILHPLSLKKKILFFFSDKGKSLYSLSASLLEKEIKVPAVSAYGELRNGIGPFFVMSRIDGRSLNDILIRNNEVLPFEVYRKVMAEIAGLHKAGYWLGDAHLDHVFIKDGEVSGFIDIDGIRKNRFYSLKNYAKDIAGLNHYRLTLTEDKKKKLLDIYIEMTGINDPEHFCGLLKKYSVRRWEGRTLQN